MASQTPIRIRGKRGAPKEVEWHSGKKRKVTQAGSATASQESSSSRSTPSTEESVSRRGRRKQQPPELSRLEQLPTEVLQAIFEFSANLDLPLASKRLASQLASKHLYRSLTSIVLDRDFDHSRQANEDIQAAMRLMNSRFFTWSFFRAWLREESDRPNFLCEWLKVYRPGESGSWPALEEWTWLQLHPKRRPPPPIKLLRGPFTQDRIQFLEFFTRNLSADAQDLYPSYFERAKEGLQQAVSEGSVDAFHSFWAFALWPDTEMLRTAVIDSGCDEKVVTGLVDREIHHRRWGSTEVDLLDPALWSWADKAQDMGDGKGRWLKDLLGNSKPW